MRALLTCALLATTSLLPGCANPVNKITMDEYTDQCIAAENSGRFNVAIEACRRAWINSRIGNLGGELESRTLYNYGRVARKAMKLDDAETALKRSLELEESISGVSSEKVGRRLAELALTKIIQRKSVDGVSYVERLVPIAGTFAGPERKVVCGVLFGYTEDFRSSNLVEKSAEFDVAAKALSCSRADFKN